MKKTLALMLALIMVISVFSVSSVFAARSLNDYEKAIIAELKSGVVVDGKTISIPSEYINQAETYLQSRETPVTEAEQKEIMAQISVAKAAVKESGATSIKDLPASVKNTIVSAATKAAATIGLKLEYSSSNSSIKIIDSTGKVVFEASNVVKATGFDVTASVVTVSVLTVLMAAVVVFARKQKCHE